MTNPTILWCCDQPGWAYDHRAKGLGKLLPDYEHQIVYDRTGINQLAEKADIVVVMFLETLQYLSKKYDDRIVMTLTSPRQFRKRKIAVLYYTDNSLENTTLGKTVWDNLVLKVFDLPITVVSQKPFDSKRNICVGSKPKNSGSVIEQILAGLDTFTPDTYVFLAEHDVLYHQSHFSFILREKTTYGQFNYNTNHFRCTKTGYCIGPTDKPLSMCSGFACDLRRILTKKLELYKKGGKHLMGCIEPGRGKNPFTEYTINTYISAIPSIDIRHDGCLSMQSGLHVVTDKLNYWGDNKKLRKKLGV